jgi:Ca-activated chloride channel homolog
MRLPRPIQNSLLLLIVFAVQKICAQLAPADHFFNSGAQFYISNNIPAALERTESGLKLYPDDEKLKKLEQLLKQQQQSQSQSQQNQQNQQQQQSQSQQNKSDEQKQNQANEKKDEQQKQAEQQKSSAEKSNDEKQNQDGQEQASNGQMTPEEAKRLLDAQKGDEQVLQLKPQGKPQDNQRPVKDW